MSNGCGCQTGLLKYLRPPYAKLFYVACCRHDDNYESDMPRKEADRLLFRDMLYIVYKGDYKVMYSLFLISIAYLYYICVRLFGWQYKS